jgi:hypothetical protein
LEVSEFLEIEVLVSFRLLHVIFKVRALPFIIFGVRAYEERGVKENKGTPYNLRITYAIIKNFIKN